VKHNIDNALAAATCKALQKIRILSHTAYRINKNTEYEKEYGAKKIKVTGIMHMGTQVLPLTVHLFLVFC
jgi:hypothetical protein